MTADDYDVYESGIDDYEDDDRDCSHCGGEPDMQTNGATGLGPMFLPMPPEEAEAQRQRLQTAGTLTPDILRAAVDEMSSESRMIPEPEWPLPPAGTDWSDWQVVVLPFWCERCGYRECRRCQGCYCPDQPRTCDVCDDLGESHE